MDPSAELFVRYAARGDVDALGEVFDRTAPKLLRLAMHLAHTADDAEDLLQATFVLAMRKANEFDANQPLLPWLSGILAGEAKNLARRNARRRTDELPELVADGAGGPVDAAERRELVAQLRARVDELPNEQRQALLLQLQHGLSPAAIAEVLDVPPGTVRMRLHRGLQALRKLLPSGLAVWLSGMFGTRGLAAVRAEVLRHASAVRAASVGGMAATAAGVMAMKYTVGGVAVLIAAAVCWWSVQAPDPAPVRDAAREGARAVPAGEAATAGSVAAAERIAASASEAPRDGTGSLRVRVVTKEGAVPLRDVALRLWPGSEPVPPHDPSNRFVRSGDDGGARFESLSPGPWQVVATGFRDAAAAVTVVAGTGTEHELALAARTLRGIVVDTQGVAVAGAAIKLADSSEVIGQPATEGLRLDLVLRVAAYSAADGTFTCAAGDEEDYVAASHPDFRSSQTQLTRAVGVESFRLVLLPRTTSLGGSVLDPQRQPIAGAVVAARVLRDVERSRDGTWLGPPLIEITTTDAAGRFALTALPAGGTTLVASAAGFVRADRFSTTTDGGALSDVEIVLAPAMQITGTVRSADGSPLPDVTVAASRKISGMRLLLARSLVRGDGRFALTGLGAPPFSLFVLRANSTADLLVHPIEATGQRSLHVDLVVPARPALRGRVVADGDLPLANWVVVVRDLATQHNTWIRTDERGEFVVAHLTGERVNVSVMSPHAPVSLGKPDAVVQAEVSVHTSELELRVPARRLPRASVAGRLVDHAGNAIAGATLLFAVEDVARCESVTSGDGAFCVRAVPAGTYEMRLTGVPQPRTLRSVTVGEDDALELGVVSVLPAATLRVELALADGSPWRGMLPNVWVQRSGANARDWLPKLDAGGCEGAVEPGPVRIEVTDPDLIAQAQDVELLPGERRVVRLLVSVGRSVDLVFAGDGDSQTATSVATDKRKTGRIDATDRLHVEVLDKKGVVVLRDELRRSPHGDGDWTLEHTFAFGEYTVTARTDSDRRYGGAFAATDSMPQRRIAVPRLP